MIWIPPPTEESENSHTNTNEAGKTSDKTISVGFRKQFTIQQQPVKAQLHIFADSHYLLWVNGQYLLRGPCRFDPKRPEYDTVDIKHLLQKGLNTLAVLVQSGLSNGKIMKHAGGLAVQLEVQDAKGKVLILTTDKTWRCSSQTRFLEYAINTDGNKWGQLYPRSIPLLRQKKVSPAAIVQIKQGEEVDNQSRPLPQTLPVEISAPAEMVIDVGRMIQAYWVLDFQADHKTELTVIPCQTFIDAAAGTSYGIENHYKARAGRQSYMSTDTFGFKYLHIKLDSGRLNLHGVKFINLTYPFDCLGRFNCNDGMLNELWGKAINTIQLCSEDGYEDCALRERAEWMGDGAVVEYPITRIAFAGPGQNGKHLYSDPRLIRNMLRHLALSQQEDGRIKAHHPSDRWDIHGYIEDYACLWVQALRQYYDNTADIDFVAEVWPVLTKQMQWFLDRRTETGLIKAREFVIFDNPLIYQVCQGATINAFIYRALVDAVYLAKALGKNRLAEEYNAAASCLFRDFNQHLWDENSQTYLAGIKDGKKLAPTAHAALLSLNRDIVPEDRLDSVRKWLLAHYKDSSGINFTYTHFFLFEEFYRMDCFERDMDVLQIIRKRWSKMVESNNPGTLFENFDGGSLCHNFGAVPAYFLSAYILGVRTDEPVWNKTIIIEPRLGDLREVEGTVVTEHGLVPVSWKKADDDRYLNFSFEVPAGITAKVSIPKLSDKPTLIINGKTVVADGVAEKRTELGHRFVTLIVKSGKYSGKMAP
jgi:hypothetical protein